MSSNNNRSSPPVFIERRVKTFKEVYLAESPTPALERGEELLHPFVPPGSSLYLTHRRKSTSIADVYGVRILYSSGNGEVKRCHWFCLLGDCYKHGQGTKIEISPNSTHRATEHLSKRHSIYSSKTCSTNSNLGRIQGMRDTSAPGFAENPSRFYQLQFSGWAAEHCIPFNTFCGNTWRLIASTLPRNGTTPPMTTLDVARHQLEQYMCIKRNIIAEIDEARRFYGIRFLSLNADLYQNSVMNLKFLGIRVSWIMDGFPKSKNIAMRLYNPLYAEKDSHTASELLYKWLNEVLIEYGISIEDDIYSAIGNGGPDMRYVMDKMMSGLREWCLSHILNLCLVDTFGAHHEKKFSKNLEARTVIDMVRKMIEHINKSSKLKTKLDEIMVGLVRHCIKLKNSPHHHWSAIEDVLSRVLSQWNPILQAYASVENEQFPLTNQKGILFEFYSLLQVVRKIQIKSQQMRGFTAVTAYWEKVHLFCKTLRKNAPLGLLHPDTGDKVDQYRPADELDPRLVTVKDLLRAALLDRYFFRCHPLKAVRCWCHFYGKHAVSRGTQKTVANISLKDFKSDYVLELQSMMHPRGRKLGAFKHCVLSIPIEDSDYPEDFPDELKGNECYLRATFIKLVEAALWRHI